MCWPRHRVVVRADDHHATQCRCRHTVTMMQRGRSLLAFALLGLCRWLIHGYISVLLISQRLVQSVSVFCHSNKHRRNQSVSAQSKRQKKSLTLEGMNSVLCYSYVSPKVVWIGFVLVHLRLAATILSYHYLDLCLGCSGQHAIAMYKFMDPSSSVPSQSSWLTAHPAVHPLFWDGLLMSTTG